MDDDVVKAKLEELLNDGSIKYWLGGHMAEVLVELACKLIAEGLARKDGDA